MRTRIVELLNPDVKIFFTESRFFSLSSPKLRIVRRSEISVFFAICRIVMYSSSQESNVRVDSRRLNVSRASLTFLKNSSIVSLSEIFTVMFLIFPEISGADKIHRCPNFVRFWTRPLTCGNLPVPPFLVPMFCLLRSNRAAHSAFGLLPQERLKGKK